MRVTLLLPKSDLSYPPYFLSWLRELYRYASDCALNIQTYFLVGSSILGNLPKNSSSYRLLFRGKKRKKERKKRNSQRRRLGSKPVTNTLSGGWRGWWRQPSLKVEGQSVEPYQRVVRCPNFRFGEILLQIYEGSAVNGSECKSHTRTNRMQRVKGELWIKVRESCNWEGVVLLRRWRS